ncbi:MAG TPA: hypothetical protein VHJ76_04000, partial [Actinomycetota bacterium]|nr:hypothetical protein [Actinomycetota bacterium]
VRDRNVVHVPFPDVDRDGVSDVMELDLDLREQHPTYGFEGTLRINTLDGRSGRVLGRYELPFHSGVPVVTEARIGDEGVPGVFVFLTRFISTADAPTSELEVRAVTGTGREVWMREWISTSTSTASRAVAATNVAIPTDLLAPRARSTDVLLGVYDYAGPVISMTPVVVSGEDGSSRSLEPLVVPWLETTPWPVTAPDLDGDGADDVLTVDTSGRSTGIMATSSASGERLWHNETVGSGFGTMVAELGDVVGDDTPDFVLGEPLRLFDGADGDVVWNRDGGSYVVAHGDVDGDRRSDVLAGRALYGASRFGADFSVVSSRGDRLADRRYAARRTEDGLTWVIAEEPGDVDGDRLPDAFLHLLHYGSQSTTEQRFAISGRSLRPIARGNLFALGDSLGGEPAADLLRAERAGGSYRLTAIDGGSGRPLWSRRVAVSKAMGLGFHPWAAGGSQGRRDLAVSFVSARSGRGLLLDGATGRLLWERSLAP